MLSMPYSLSDYSSLDLEQSDDDSWLYDGEEDLTAALLARQKEMDAYESKQEKRSSIKGTSSASNDKNLTSEEMEIAQAAEVVKNVQSFVDKISSFEGAEIPAHE